jgi:hypothetical protein
MTHPLLCLAASAVLGGTAPADVPLERATRVGIQTWQAPLERVLPLLTPQGEMAWAEGWEPDIRWQAPGNGEGTLFVIHEQGGRETLWVLTTFDKQNGRVAYSHLLPGVLLVELTITLSPLPEGRTRGEVRYTFTALSERGNARVSEISEEHFAGFTRDWERALNHYLQTGQRLDAPHH